MHEGREPATESPKPSSRRAVTAGPILLIIAACFMPFLGFAYDNSKESFSLARLLLYAAITSLMSLAAFVLLAMVLRRVPLPRLGAALAAAIISFFSFSRWLESSPRNDRVIAQLAIWALATVIATILVYRLSRSQLFVRWLTATVAVLCALYTGAYAIAGVESTPADSERAHASRLPTVTPDTLANKRNVYAFLLDQYARNDVLADVLGEDNAPFYDELRERGFVVSEMALSSYNKTSASMAAMFEMDYPSTGAEAGEVPNFDSYLLGDNATVARFRELGYQYLHAHGGPFSFARCTAELADLCLPPDSSDGALDDLQLTLLDLTPIGSLDLFDTPWADPRHVVETLRATSVEEPFFLFAHIISPHPPYRFDAGCSRRSPPTLPDSISYEENVAAYANDVRCLNAQMTEVIDELLVDDPTGIVLIFSDHGTSFLTPDDQPLAGWSDRALVERFGTLNAMLLPEGCRSMVEPTTPNVHVFSIVFACLEGRDPLLADFRAFLWTVAGIEEVPADRLEGG